MVSTVIEKDSSPPFVTYEVCGALHRSHWWNHDRHFYELRFPTTAQVTLSAEKPPPLPVPSPTRTVPAGLTIIISHWRCQIIMKGRVEVRPNKIRFINMMEKDSVHPAPSRTRFTCPA
jgi:hypothetical protein